MFEAIQYLVLLRKLKDDFDVKILVAVNGRRKITRLWDDNRGQTCQKVPKDIKFGDESY